MCSRSSKIPNSYFCECWLESRVRLIFEKTQCKIQTSDLDIDFLNQPPHQLYIKDCRRNGRNSSNGNCLTSDCLPQSVIGNRK